jgi:N-acetylneuraminate synthase/N,N'-diacetyllegionaminate synthase
MLQRLELLPEMHRELMAYSEARGLLFMSTAFDEISADLLDSLDIPAFKIPSGEITNLPYLRHIARKQRPMIVSTGMATLGEVETTLHTIHAEYAVPVVVLHCVSSYPTAPQDVNLRAMHTLRTAFDVPVGFSDHTLGAVVPLAAVALGACMIEKHLTLDKSLPGPDHQASMTPDEFAAMMRDIRAVEAALGDGRKRPTSDELQTAAVVRKSLVAAVNIRAGQTLDADMIAIMRPGTGLPPADYDTLIGRTARRDIPAGTVFTHEILA